VGTKLEVTPRVNGSRDITLLVKPEVSEVSGYVTGANGQQLPIVGRRTTETQVTLRTAAVRRVSLLSGIFRGIIVLALIVFTCNIGAFAQLSATATITGTVTDSNGALVPAATVTITDDATSVSLKTQSNGRGVYVAPDLNVATYSITIAKAGFKIGIGAAVAR